MENKLDRIRQPGIPVLLFLVHYYVYVCCVCVYKLLFRAVFIKKAGGLSTPQKWQSKGEASVAVQISERLLQTVKLTHVLENLAV